MMYTNDIFQLHIDEGSIMQLHHISSRRSFVITLECLTNPAGVMMVVDGSRWDLLIR